MSAFLVGAGLLLIIAGFIFMLLGSIGIIRLPDFYTRTHAASMVDTVGIILVLLGVALFEGFTTTSLKVVLTSIFLAMTNPVAAHALARAAYLKGLEPWKKGEPIRPAQPLGEND